MIVDKDTPGAPGIKIWLDGELIGGVVRANLDEHWVDVYETRTENGRRVYTDKVVRRYGRITTHIP